MHTHPTYLDTDQPIIIGDIVVVNDVVCVVTGICETAIGTLISGNAISAPTSFCTEDISKIHLADKAIAKKYAENNLHHLCEQLRNITENLNAKLVQIKLVPLTAEYDEYDSEEQTQYHYGLVPKTCDINTIAPWAVCNTHPVMPCIVKITNIESNISYIRTGLFDYAYELIHTYEDCMPNNGHLWLVEPNAIEADWQCTPLDNLCKIIERITEDYVIDIEDTIAQIETSCHLYKTNTPNASIDSPEKRSLNWWYVYASTLKDIR